MSPHFDTSFWQSFWPSLIAGIATSIIFTGIIVGILREYRRPKLTIEIMFVHHAPSSKKKTLIFNLTNNGYMSLETNEAHCFIFFELLSFNAFGSAGGTTTDKGPFHLIEVFNDKPCHPRAKIKLFEITTEMASPFPHEWIDQSPMYINIFTSRGRWVPGLFSKSRKSKLKHRGEFLGYQITDVVV